MNLFVDGIIETNSTWDWTKLPTINVIENTVIPASQYKLNTGMWTEPEAHILKVFKAKSSRSYTGPLRKSDPSMGINGIPPKMFETPPLTVQNELEAVITEHCFKIIDDCPANLLGRYLFDFLGISMTTPQNDGLDISSNRIHIQPKLCNYFTNLPLTDEIPVDGQV